MGQLFEVKWGELKGQVGEKTASYSSNKQTFYTLRMERGTLEHVKKEYVIPYKKPKVDKTDAVV